MANRGGKPAPGPVLCGSEAAAAWRGAWRAWRVLPLRQAAAACAPPARRIERAPTSLHHPVTRPPCAQTASRGPRARPGRVTCARAPHIRPPLLPAAAPPRLAARAGKRCCQRLWLRPLHRCPSVRLGAAGSAWRQPPQLRPLKAPPAPEGSEAGVGAEASPLGVASATSASRDSSPLAGAGASEDRHACAGVAAGNRSASPPQPAPAAATLHAGVVIPHRVPRASARASGLPHSGLRRALSGSLERTGRPELDQARRGRAEGVQCTADHQLPRERSPTPGEPKAGPKRQQP